MFQPEIFRETRRWVMHELIRAHPFATLVTTAAGALAADHLPFVLHEEDGEDVILRGHLGAANPLCHSAPETGDALVIFQGPQTYVTPSWYASKSEHGRVVPTWNYVSVHARGGLRLVRNADWLQQHLHALTTQLEGNRPVPWSVADAPEDFVTRQFRGLVGIEIEITDLQGVWKVSQNKSPADRGGVIAGLRTEGDADQLAISGLVDARGRQ